MEQFIDSRRPKIKRSLHRGVIDALNLPQYGLGVTSKSSTPREKIIVSILVNSFALFNSCIYFEHFTLLELDLYLASLGCKPKLEIVVA